MKGKAFLYGNYFGGFCGKIKSAKNLKTVKWTEIKILLIVSIPSLVGFVDWIVMERYGLVFS